SLVERVAGSHASEALMAVPLLPKHREISHGSHTSEVWEVRLAWGQELDHVPALIYHELPRVLSTGPRDELCFASAVCSANPYGDADPVSEEKEARAFKKPGE
ncbi:hypothetical protein HispidOSU_009288, partial [Sigmodon hispidus]